MRPVTAILLAVLATAILCGPSSPARGQEGNSLKFRDSDSPRTARVERPDAPPTPPPAQQPAAEPLSKPYVYDGRLHRVKFTVPAGFAVGHFRAGADKTGFFTNAMVLVDLKRSRRKAEEMQNLEISDVPIISVVPVTGDQLPIWQELSKEQSAFWKENGPGTMPKHVQVGQYRVSQLPDFPAPFGDGAIVYTIQPSTDQLFVVMALRTFPNKKPTGYDAVIRQVLASMKFTE